MSLFMYDLDEEVYYPFLTKKSDKVMKVLDRELIIHRKTRKAYVRYLLSDLLTHLAASMHENTNAEYDNCILVTGPEGSGKSQLAYQLCKAYDPNFNMEEGYIYDYDEFLTAITSQDKDDRGRIFWLDEGTNIASNRDSMVTDNKRFIQLLEMMRSRGWSLVICIPSIERIDRYIREQRVRYHLETYEKRWDDRRKEVSRGYFELRFKWGGSYKPGAFRSIGYGIFEQMTPEEREVYDRIKAESQEAKMREIRESAAARKGEDNRGKAVDANKRLCLYLHEDLGISYDEIAHVTGMNKNWARDQCCYGRKLKKAEENE